MDASNSYFTISELAKELDVKKSHIRFCEENGLIPPRASKLKRRVYGRYDRERLKLVFHFVLQGYSKEEIIDLIGITDANLDENDQLMQGIIYGQRELKKLEKRKEELSFAKQTRIINEIEMMREYINRLKIIKSGVPEDRSARPSFRFQEKIKMPTKPVMVMTGDAEKNGTQHPVKSISFFVAGLALVILMGSYFYYQAGQKEARTIKLVQNKQVHSGKILKSEVAELLDQAAKGQVEAPEAKKIPESTSSALPESLKAPSTDASLDVTKRNREIPSESDTNLLENEKFAEDQLDAHKTDSISSKDDAIHAGRAKETLPPHTSKEKPVTAGDASISKKQEFVNRDAEVAIKDGVQKEIAGEDLLEKEIPAAEGEDTLETAVSESEKEQETDIEVKEAPESKFVEKVYPDTNDVSLSQEKQKLDISKVDENQRDDIVQEVDAKDLKEEAVPDVAGEKTITGDTPEPGMEKVAKIEVNPSLTESKEKMEQITSEKDMNQHVNELSRLKSFLDEYCQAYTNKDLDKFITFFASDATENNKPFHELLQDYRKNMESMESLTYRIELTSYSKQIASENLVIRGRFFTRFQLQKGVWEENNGSIFMELLEHGDSFLVKQLTYSN